MEKTIKKIKFYESDRKILKCIEPVVEAIAKSFGNNCEVVLHSLEDLSKSIIKIENGYVTGRKIGSPITNLGIKFLKEADTLKKDITGVYFEKTRDGKILKSITVIIRNSRGKPIGLLCININLSITFIQMINNFVPKKSNSKKGFLPEYFGVSMEELIKKSLEEAILNIDKKEKISQINKNKLIILELYKKGIFDIKGAIDLIAQEIGVSRYTVYNYLKEVKIKFRSELKKPYKG